MPIFVFPFSVKDYYSTMYNHILWAYIIYPIYIISLYELNAISVINLENKVSCQVNHIWILLYILYGTLKPLEHHHQCKNVFDSGLFWRIIQWRCCCCCFCKWHSKTRKTPFFNCVRVLCFVGRWRNSCDVHSSLLLDMQLCDVVECMFRGNNNCEWQTIYMWLEFDGRIGDVCAPIHRRG